MVEDANARAALDVLARLLEVRDPDDLPREIVAAVGDAIDHDGAVFAAMSTGGAAPDGAWPAEITAGPVAASFEERAGSLALVPHTPAGRGSFPRRSEVVGDVAFRSSTTPHNVVRPVGGNHLLAISFRLPGDRIACLALNRVGADFDDDDVARLNAIGRHLTRLARFSRLWRTPPAARTALTPCERRVLSCVAEGLTNRAAARRLGVAEATVHKHLEHAYRKLGVTNRVAATVAWLGERS